MSFLCHFYVISGLYLGYGMMEYINCWVRKKRMKGMKGMKGIDCSATEQWNDV